MKTYRIALCPGDGIGKEVLAESMRVLSAVENQLGNYALETTELGWGADLITTLSME